MSSIESGNLVVDFALFVAWIAAVVLPLLPLARKTRTNGVIDDEHARVSHPTLSLTMQAYERLSGISRPSANGSARLGPRSRESSTDPLLNFFDRLKKAYALAIERSKQRRQLLGMDDRELKDIGITRLEAEQEARQVLASWQPLALVLCLSLLTGRARLEDEKT